MGKFTRTGNLVEFLQQPQRGHKIVLVEDAGYEQGLASPQQEHDNALVHVYHSGEHAAVP